MRSLYVHLFPTTQYIKNIKEEKKARNKKQQRQWRFLKKELHWKSQKKILWMKRKLTRTKKKKINVAVSINSVGKMLW